MRGSAHRLNDSNQVYYFCNYLSNRFVGGAVPAASPERAQAVGTSPRSIPGRSYRMPRVPDVLIRIVFALLVVLGVAAAVLRFVAPDDLATRAELVRARTLVVLGMTQPAPDKRAQVIAEADRKFATQRGVTRVHILAGAAFLVLASLQLTRRVRIRSPKTHRVTGRIAIVFAWMSGLTGVLFSLSQPLGGLPEQVVVGAVGLFLLGSTSIALHHIRAGRVEAHREWMLRGVASALAIASVRVVSIPIDLALAPRGVDVRVVFALSLWVGWILTMAGAEWWIRSTRVR